MERYQRIYLNDNKLYVPEAGIVICAQAILKDNKTNKAIAQVKFQNTLDKEIVALFVNVDCYDITEKKLDSVTNYQFLDLKEKRGSYFGSKTAITLPNNNTRRISVSIQKLVYDDGSIWENAQIDYVLLAEPEIISNDIEVRKQAQLEFGNVAQYKYQKYDELWICSCGALNHNHERNCHSCGISEDKLIETPLAILVERKNQRVAEETRIAQEEEKAQAILEEERRKRNKKIALVALGVGLIALTIFIIIATKPARTIARAEKLVKEKDYVTALALLEELHLPENTRDIRNEIIDLMEEDVDVALSQGNLHEAIELLEKYVALPTKESYWKTIQEKCSHDKVVEKTKDATCEKEGFSRKTCEVCKRIEETVYDALGHSLSSTVIKDATCEVKGVEKLTCSVCEYEKEKETMALGHDYKETVVKQTTCTTSGIVKHTCSRCGSFNEENAKALGHSWASATCITDGKCSRCGITGEKATGHSWKNTDNGIKCSSCSTDYPANVKFVGFPTSTTDGQITLTSMRIDDICVLDQGSGKFAYVEFSYFGVNKSSLPTTVWVRVLDSSGKQVNIDSVLVSAGNFEAKYLSLSVPLNDTYTIKIAW